MATSLTSEFGEITPDGSDRREGLVLSDPAICHSMAGRGDVAQWQPVCDEPDQCLSIE